MYKTYMSLTTKLIIGDSVSVSVKLVFKWIKLYLWDLSKKPQKITPHFGL